MQNPKYEDDLMYASEAIQKIASEAMQRVENLYKLRFSLPPVSPEPEGFEKPTRERKSSRVSTVEAPEKIDTTFDLVDNFTHNLKPVETKPKAGTVKPNLQSALTGSIGSIDERPEKIDSNLHGLTL